MAGNDFFDSIAHLDTLDDVDTSSPTESPTERMERLKSEVTTAETFKDKCPSCNGTGRYHGYSRHGGACFKCKGKGFRTFKTSPEARAAARDKAAAKKVAKADDWKRANADEWSWIVARAQSFSFAAAMQQAVNQYGSLTDNQLAAVQRCIVGDAERAERKAREAEEREVARAARVEAAPTVTVDAIVEAFATARGNGIKFPKLRLAAFTFSRASDDGKNAGALYVKRGSEYLGKVQGGKFLCVAACDKETEGQVVQACNDPKAAAIAYGQQFGACSVCGRELTNKASIELGIGPICASKFGWG